MLYNIGLILVILYILTGIDDFIWDIITILRRTRYQQKLLNLHDLDSKPPKLIAVVIAAWREDNVLGDVIENLIESTHYPKSMYHIFLGVYPNDEPTQNVAKALSEKYPNVHMIKNCLPGPTSKAQNINYVITQIKQFEQEHNWRFAALTVHDSEDIVHPFELKVTNYLIEKYPALQFPVFPLIPMPKFSNFFKFITSGTYADEFAENHFTTMVSRYNSGAFVPSAGTGFSLSRETLDSFGNEDVLPKNSLTEDYKLSLSLFEKGIQMCYVLEKVPRISQDGKLTWDFISTRSMFPNTFKAAVKQKARWILGITMQSFKFKDIFKIKGLRFAGRYSLYKDFKAKIGNLLVMLGYPVFIYFIISLFISLPAIYPKYTLSWYLCVAVTIMMIERQVFRSVAIYNVYGIRSVFFACLFPPIMPIRLVWGNIINLTATLKAYKQSIFGNKDTKKKVETAAKNKVDPSHNPTEKKLVWAKTDHTFLDKEILMRYHRRLGDIFLEKGYVTPDQLKEALKTINGTNQTIGNYFIKNNIISEQELLTALSYVKHIQYVETINLSEYNITQYADYFDRETLEELIVVPLMKTNDGFVIAFCDNSPINAQTILREKYSMSVKAAFASQDSIQSAITTMYESNQAPENSEIDELYLNSKINYEQSIIARKYKELNNMSGHEILTYMGLTSNSVCLNSESF